MNVYEKLLKARLALKGIKKGGKNEYAKYDYYELGDFLPKVMEICSEVKIIPMVSFGDVATLTIVDLEKPDDKIVFESPMSAASLKGCHEVQNLGAVETYLRRYLYQTAFEIVESDILEQSVGNPAQKKDKFDDSELRDFEVRISASDLTDRQKQATLKMLPSYSRDALNALDEKLKKRGF